MQEMASSVDSSKVINHDCPSSFNADPPARVDLVGGISSAGCRTPWADLSLGQGFHRETGEQAASAVQFKLLDQEPGWTAQPHALIEVLTGGSAFSDALSAGE
jgi:hypothetical protein